MDEQNANPPISYTVQTNLNTSLNRKGNEKRTSIRKCSTIHGDKKYEKIQSPDKLPKKQTGMENLGSK